MNTFLGYPSESVINWIKEHTKKDAGPLCFEAVGSDMTVAYGNNYAVPGGMQQAGINFQYSTDNVNWTDWVLTT